MNKPSVLIMGTSTDETQEIVSKLSELANSYDIQPNIICATNFDNKKPYVMEISDIADKLDILVLLDESIEKPRPTPKYRWKKKRYK